jgi:hypothetical protein
MMMGAVSIIMMLADYVAVILLREGVVTLSV